MAHDLINFIIETAGLGSAQKKEPRNRSSYINIIMRSR